MSRDGYWARHSTSENNQSSLIPDSVRPAINPLPRRAGRRASETAAVRHLGVRSDRASARTGVSGWVRAKFCRACTISQPDESGQCGLSQRSLPYRGGRQWCVSRGANPSALLADIGLDPDLLDADHEACSRHSPIAQVVPLGATPARIRLDQRAQSFPPMWILTGTVTSDTQISTQTFFVDELSNISKRTERLYENSRFLGLDESDRNVPTLPSACLSGLMPRFPVEFVVRARQNLRQRPLFRCRNRCRHAEDPAERASRFAMPLLAIDTLGRRSCFRQREECLDWSSLVIFYFH